MIYRNKEIGAGSVIIVLLFFAAFMVGLFYLMKGLYSIMLYVAPILAISILAIDYKSYIAYGRWISRKYRKNLMSGLTWTFLSIAGFPFVLFILLYRAVFLKGLGHASKHSAPPFERRREALEYHDYEIIDDESEA